MKSLASLLICSIFLLSAFGGRVKPVAVVVKEECCAKSNKKHCVKTEHKPVAEDCEKQGCAMLLSCSICGFLTEEPVVVRSLAVLVIENPVPIYKHGNLAVYMTRDWKPPKV